MFRSEANLFLIGENSSVESRAFHSEGSSVNDSVRIRPVPTHLSSNNNSIKLCNHDEAELRLQLKWFFLCPFEKYRLRKKKPWKLFFQILKIVLITVQLILLSSIKINNIHITRDVHQVLKTIFLDGYTVDDLENINPDYYLYSKQQVMDQLNFSYYRYNQLEDLLYGIFRHEENNLFTIYMHFEDSDMRFIKEYIKLHSFFGFKIDDRTLIYEVKKNENMIYFLQSHLAATFITKCKKMETSFGLVTETKYKFFGIYFFYCYDIQAKVIYSNSRLSGRISVSMETNPIQLECQTDSLNGPSYVSVLHFLTVLDGAIIFLCTISIIACEKSLVTHIKLLKRTCTYFKIHEKPIVLSEKLIFVNWWVILILLGDLTTTIGTICKIIMDYSVNLYPFVVCLLGISCTIAWIGSLRYLTYFRTYNSLLVIIHLSFATFIRFFVCVIFLFIGFVFYGYITLGPYHKKFETLITSSECIFSLMNGDEIFDTFRMLNAPNTALKFFGDTYIALVSIIFIYLVVTIFIAIVCHYHEYQMDENNKLYGDSQVMEFIERCHCQDCTFTKENEKDTSSDSSHSSSSHRNEGHPIYSTMTLDEDHTSRTLSQLSYVNDERVNELYDLIRDETI